MITQSILTFVILFFISMALVIATEEIIQSKNRAIDTIAPVHKSTNARKLGVFRRAKAEMALSPLDFLTKKELQEMELLQVVLEFRQALDYENSHNKNKKPLQILYSHIEGAFVRSRSRKTHVMDKFFFDLWEHFQDVRQNDKNGEAEIEAFKQKYRQSMPANLPDKQREELAAVIASIDTFS